MKLTGAFFWRKLDHPGSDSCRLFELEAGWRLQGTAVFWEKDRPNHLAYEVDVDSEWRTRRAKVSGFQGNKAVKLALRATRKHVWTLNGEPQPAVEGCVDVDLGFTPATNLLALRRLALKIGERAEAPAAYLAFPDLRMTKLEQTYVRTGRNQYDYEAPRFGYRASLQVAWSGAVVLYPGLFEQVTSA
jgi:uncharacterized protein